MKIRTKLWAGLAALMMTAPAMAADTKPQAMDAAMAQAIKLGAPGDGHKVLAPLAGTFNATVRFWMKPGDKAQESKGVSENTWILGGRFLKQMYSGSMNGGPFNGLGLCGFDNLRGEYNSVWVDNMMTGMMVASGAYDPKSKTLASSGTFSCPMTGEKNHWFRTELKIKDDNTHTYASYSKDPTGKEFKDLEITYERVK